MPDWDHHIPKPWQYPGHPHPLALPEAIVMVTRGCPHKCTFCGNPYNGSKVRWRNYASVYAEFTYLKSHGVQGVFLYDDEIIEHQSLATLYHLLEAQPARFALRAQGRCNLRSEDVTRLQNLHERGLQRVMWGIESFSQPVLNAMKKGTTLDGIMTSLKLSHYAGIENFAFLMAGMPEETPEAARESLRHLTTCFEKGLIQKAQVTVCTPMLGTPLYEQAKAEGWLPQSDPYQYDIGGGTPWMSQGDLADHVNAMRRLAAKYGAL